MAQVSVQRVSAQWGASRLPTRRAVQHRARVAAPTRCEFDVDNASILVAGETRGGAGRVKEERVKEEAALSRAAIPATQGTGRVGRRNAVLAEARNAPPPTTAATATARSARRRRRLRAADHQAAQGRRLLGVAAAAHGRAQVRARVQSARGLLVGRVAVQACWRRRLAGLPLTLVASRAAAQEGD